MFNPNVVGSILLFALFSSAQTSAPDRIRLFPADQSAVQWLTEKAQSDATCRADIQQIVDRIEIQASDTPGSIRVKAVVGVDGRITSYESLAGSEVLTDRVLKALKRWSGEPIIEAGRLTTPLELVVDVDFNVYARSLPVFVPFPPTDSPEQITITLERSGCYGRCPVYQVTVRGDGSVEYEGLGNVFLKGKHKGSVSRDQFLKLLEAFRKADFFSLEDAYVYRRPTEVFLQAGGCVTMRRGIYGLATHLPTKVTSLQIGDRRKRVEHYDGAPASLTNLENEIDRIVNSDRWLVGNDETVQGLVAEGYDVNEAKTPPILGAAEFSNAMVVRDLIRAGARVNVADQSGYTPLIFAALRGLPEMVRLLLDAGADANAADRDRVTTLMYGAQSGDESVVRQLLDAGARVKDRDTRGGSALMDAAASGNPKVVQLLLDAKAAVNDRNWWRTTPLIAAVRGTEHPTLRMFGVHPQVPEELVDRGAVVRMLIAAGANVNSKDREGQNALFTIEEDALAELLKTKIDLNARDNWGETALASSVSYTLTRLLIKAGADPEIADKNGATPLMHAADNNYIDILKVLIAAGVKLDSRDREGRTALFYAVESGLETPVSLLLEAKADPNIRTRRGKSALEVAKEKPASNLLYRKIVRILTEAGARD